MQQISRETVPVSLLKENASVLNKISLFPNLMLGALSDYPGAPFSLDASCLPDFKPQHLDGGSHAAVFVGRGSPTLSQQVRNL
jgi:hypothetical protein